MSDLGGNLNDLMRAAQNMQKEMERAQQELSDMRVTGEAGGGLVKVEMDGRHQVRSMKLHPGLADEELEVVGDLCAAAVNDAVRKIEKASRDQISKLTAGLKIPPGFGDIAGGDDSGTSDS